MRHAAVGLFEDAGGRHCAGAPQRPPGIRTLPTAVAVAPVHTGCAVSRQEGGA
jgi:hypothetical protein